MIMEIPVRIHTTDHGIDTVQELALRTHTCVKYILLSHSYRYANVYLFIFYLFFLTN